jgi:transcriptional regulator with XRE-family HTH domain
MANERLRAAMLEAELTSARIAHELGLDAKSVERWVTREVVPHRSTAARAASLLRRPADWLWPSMASPGGSFASSEVVAFYPHRSVSPKQLWIDLLESARSEIVLMAYASLFLPEENPRSVEVLRAKAAAGVRVRICLGDPDTPEIALRAQEEELFDGYAGRIQMAMAYYRPLLGVPGVEFHLHRTTLYNSIYIYDDQMLVNQHVYGMYGYLAPILHLRRAPGADLFDMYATSLERVWQRSYPYAPESGRRPASRGEDRGDQRLGVA